jgi:anthraniloyl-CoA monooxygenase
MARSGGHEVEVFERNPQGATYGWGVVFSEGTLSELAGGLERLFDALDRLLVRWSTIYIHRPDSTVRVTGQPFAAIDRKALLETLATWAHVHGITPRYETALLPGDEGDYDLVVAADGVNSAWRRLHSSSYHSQETVHSSRYIWLGLERAVPGFTFVFEPTPVGLFQAHAYPYGADDSTFIVETTEATFRAAELTEASIGTGFEPRRFRWFSSVMPPTRLTFRLVRGRSWPWKTRPPFTAPSSPIPATSPRRWPRMRTIAKLRWLGSRTQPKTAPAISNVLAL